MASLPYLLITFGEVNTYDVRFPSFNIIYWAIICHRSKSCLKATYVKFKCCLLCVIPLIEMFVTSLKLLPEGNSGFLTLSAF